MKNYLRDPLLHFAALGAGLFALFLSLNEGPAAPDEIIVTAAQQQQLAGAFARVWRRPPTPAELKGLIDDWVREELANREALALGLAENDLVVRRRLRQKYEALMDQIANAVEPTEGELQMFLAANAASYSEERRYSLNHVFFSEDRRADAAADAANLLLALEDEGIDAAGNAGDALGLPERFEDARETEIANRLGQKFAQALSAQPQGRWSGPIASAYGQHLVYVEKVWPARSPELEEVRAEVLRDWKTQRVEEAREAVYDSLLERYTVSLDAVPETGADPRAP